MPPSPLATPASLSAGIVVHRSDPDKLIETLQSLARAAECLGLPGVPVTIVDQSVDADFSDRLAGILAAAGDFAPLEVTLVRSEDNRGYGAGQNRAFAASEGAWHLILNPDVALRTRALLAASQVIAECGDAVLIAPRSFTPAGLDDPLAKRNPSVLVLALRALAPAWLRRRFRRRLDDYECRDLDPAAASVDIPLASGCCMLVRRDAFAAVGGFDERFFLYFEDYDLSQRLRRQGRVVRAGAMEIIHHGGGAARKGIRHIVWFGRGAARFFQRYGWRWV